MSGTNSVDVHNARTCDKCAVAIHIISGALVGPVGDHLHVAKVRVVLLDASIENGHVHSLPYK